MQNKHLLSYLPIAQDDLTAIVDWIAKDNPSHALAFVEALAKRIGHLESHPLMGRVPRHEKLKRLGYRFLVLEDYLVFYAVHGHSVEIHRVLHGSRLLDEIL
ncbi:MAG TPA: type II toxin-antitoxin system RelE/ParE family toxin [bacterium]|jgi:toxin ParE1/3/4|nr:type II toxin-antitoxin system RelE/ParE family toxin [bacterium]